MITIERNSSDNLQHYALIVKPTHACNFNCSYCYDAETRRKMGVKKMTLEQVEQICKMFKGPTSLTWIWHGGEPTMMPVSFYKGAQEIFRRYPNLCITQGMQSNGYAISAELLETIVSNDIGIGFSTDGIHQDQRKKGSIDKLIENVKRFKDVGVNVGAISVVTPESVKDLRENFKYITEVVGTSIAFNPLFYSKEVMNNDIAIKNLSDYLDHLFDFYEYLWFNYEGSKKERSSEEALNCLFSTGKTSCHLNDCRYRWIGVDPDGTIGYCDKTLSSRYSMGNISDEGITPEKIFSSTGYKLIASEIAYRFTHYCDKCGYFELCRGLCHSTVIAYSGSAKEPEPADCALFIATQNRTFSRLDELDLYLNPLSSNFKEILIKENMYTTFEIRSVLAEMGLAIPTLRETLNSISEETGCSINIDNINITKLRLYKLLRLCNPYQSTDICDRNCKYIKVAISEVASFNNLIHVPREFSSLRGLRKACIRDILRKHKDEVYKICLTEVDTYAKLQRG